MSLAPGDPSQGGFLAAFRNRSFRYQWSGDLLTSWSFEMETIILGWYVLVATDSPLMLSLVSALHFVGTLLSPMFGVVADRVRRRDMLMAMRGVYLILALVVCTLGWSGEIDPWKLFAVALVSGLIRPSDLVVRNSLIADIIPASKLRNALALARTTMDSARIFGSLLGAGLLSSLGIGFAYGFVAAFYLISIVLTFGVERRAPVGNTGGNPWKELSSGIRYMRSSRVIMGVMSLAFLVNLCAFPLSHGLMPVLARDVYGLDENGLARLVASYATGALIGSMVIASWLQTARAGRVMVGCTLIWYALLFVLGLSQTAGSAYILLFVIGMSQSFAMVMMQVLLFTVTPEAYRGRVLGVRILAVYGLPIGLIAGGALIEAVGILTTYAAYALGGVVLTLAMAWRWPAVTDR